MTNEELKKIFDKYNVPTSNPFFFELASSLEQEPCEDCISREYILSKAHCCCDDLADDEPCCVDADDIREAPSVQPKARTEVLDKIRAEIEQACCKVTNDYDKGRNYGLYIATEIINKYKAESEDKE